MIRLGSLAGYPFEGPRTLGGWTPPARPGVFAILYRPDAEARPESYAVTYVGHADDLAAAGLPFDHPAAPCWIERAGSRWKVHIAVYEIPGGLRGHREHLVRELLAVYKPGCNDERYDQAWKDEWIGSYEAPTTGPLTTPRDASGTGDAGEG